MKPTFFESSADFRSWLERHHASARELLVGFLKVGSGRRSISWPEAVDEALCFGWIDGVRRRLDADRYVIRFTPRKAGSRWSAVNIRRIGDLKTRGLVTQAGMRAFEARTEAQSRTYSYEQSKAPELDLPLAKALKAHRKATAFMKTLAPSYQRKIIHWVMSAKSPEVRLGRLRKAMAAFESGRKL